MNRAAWHQRAAFAALILTAGSATGQSFVRLQALPGTGNTGTSPLAVSADGLYAVGYSGFPRQAIRWGRDGAPHLLTSGEAHGVSADGSVVVGYQFDAGGRSWAFVWAEAHGVELLDGVGCAAVSVSNDGTVIFGYTQFGPAKWVWDGAQWNQTQFTVYLGLNGGSLQAPTARLVSGDGSRFVGQGTIGLNWYSCVFDGAFAYVYPFSGLPTGISTTGDVTVGNIVGGGWAPARWTYDGTVTYLPQACPQRPGWVNGCNADASLAIGDCEGHAVLWIGSIGVVDLNSFLPAVGVDVQGRILAYGTAISGDGKTMVGSTPVSTEGWMAILPCPPSDLSSLPCSACPQCAADYDNNGGVDGGDLAAFFYDFEAGESCADVDLNGGVDGGDLAFFFTVFEAGGC